MQPRADAFSWLDFAVVVALGLVVSNFLLAASLAHPDLAVLFATPVRGAALVAAIIACLAVARIALASWTSRAGALILLSPLAALFFWPAEDPSRALWIPIAVVLATGLAFWRTLTKPAGTPPRTTSARVLLPIVAVYAAVFSAIGAWNVAHLELFNPKDWAVYNQSFWTTLHGHFFVNSIYTSYFAGHTTWFFFLLLPFYALVPDPRTLLVLKALLLALSVIPFALIARDVFGDEPPLPLLFAFLLFPFIVTQNLNAAHEMGYAPFFLLWTYWFYRRERLGWFLLLLVLALSIKEHVSAVAVAFGVLAWWQGRSRRWIAIPVTLGLVVGTFSLWFIAHMQRVYHDPGNSSWVLLNFKQRLAASDGTFIVRALKAAVPVTLTRRNSLASMALLVVPLGVVPPFLTAAWLLAAPEVALNVVIDRPAVFSPIWHYNVAASCFLLVAAVEGIRRIAAAERVRRAGLTTAQARTLVATGICALVLVHSYMWVGFITGHERPLDMDALHHAIAAVPRDAFLTAPERIVPVISARDRLSILEDQTALGDYVLVDGEPLPGQVEHALRAGYAETFGEDGIRVFRRIR